MVDREMESGWDPSKIDAIVASVLVPEERARYADGMPLIWLDTHTQRHNGWTSAWLDSRNNLTHAAKHHATAQRRNGCLDTQHTDTMQWMDTQQMDDTQRMDTQRSQTDGRHADTQRMENGHAADGHATYGHATDGHATNGLDTQRMDTQQLSKHKLSTQSSARSASARRSVAARHSAAVLFPAVRKGVEDRSAGILDADAGLACQRQPFGAWADRHRRTATAKDSVQEVHSRTARPPAAPYTASITWETGKSRHGSLLADDRLAGDDQPLRRVDSETLPHSPIS
ncbi:hypothetical protein THAOC_25459, partial [Thalassiosira oceanica]